MSEPTPDPSKALPPVVAPSGRFIAQMFLVPGLIVAGAVALLLGFSWIAGGTKSRAKFLNDLQSANPDIRWRTASDLAQVLKRDPDLATDAQFGLDLANLMAGDLQRLDRAEEALAAAKGDAKSERREAQANRSSVQYLAACLGNLMTPVGGPALADLARKKPGRDPKSDALLRRQAVWSLAALGGNLQKFAKLPDAKRAAVMADLDRLAADAKYGDWPRQAANFLTKKAPFPAVAALLACAESDDPFLREQAAMALGDWDATPEENRQIEAALLRLARDDGHGTSIRVEVGD